ncbi:hypothetical protein CRYUN_Cryun21dG0071500 [Craigia yunnanensis]
MPGHLDGELVRGTVTTIAGGNSKAIGKKDVPALNARFSNDFEVAVVAERCILLVVEYGTQSIRQIDLKPDDCATTSLSGQISGGSTLISHQIQQDMEALPNFGETNSDTLLRKSQIFADQLKDLICFDGNLESPNTSNEILKQGDGNQKGSNVLPDCHGRIDTLIQANIMGFAYVAEETVALVQSVVSSSVLVKRR